MADAAEGLGSIVNWLRSLGLTKYEALVYVALLRVPDATATEIHEISGVPRASVYPVLSQLEDTGLVSISQSSPKRFAARPPDEGIGSLLSRIERDAENARKALAVIYRERLSAERGREELIWNLYGIAAIHKKMIELIAHAGTRIRVMAHSRFFSDEIKKALAERSQMIPVEIFTHEWDGGSPAAKTITVKKPPEGFKDLHPVREMIAGGICVFDDNKVIVVIGSGDEDAVALYSESDGFVRFFARYYSLIIEWAAQSGRSGF
jgi:sugar-specific transcriptional regulator TrmB